MLSLFIFSLLQFTPMWLLKTPRDYLTTFLFIGMIVAAVIGVFVSNPTITTPAFVGFKSASGSYIFPTLFVTIACGAVSGFHSLVSSETSSKLVENEKDMLKAVEEAKAAGCNALVVFLGNFGPETPETLIAKYFDGPVMYAAAAEETGKNLINGRGDAYCGMLNCSYNLGLVN